MWYIVVDYSFPTSHTLSGAGLIVISSAIIFVREHQLKKPITLPRQQWDNLQFTGLKQKKGYQRMIQYWEK